MLSYYCMLQLWVGPGSRAAEEKQFFDTHLAPFYRIEQVFTFRLTCLYVTKRSWDPCVCKGYI